MSMDISDFIRPSLMKRTSCWPTWSNTCWSWIRWPRYRAVKRHLPRGALDQGWCGDLWLSVLQETTHLLENLLDGARRQEMSLSTEIINLFLETKDIMQEQLDAYKTSQQPDAESFEYICQALRQLALEAQQQQEAPAAQPAVQQPVVKPAAAPAAIEGGMRISLNGLKASEIPLMLKSWATSARLKTLIRRNTVWT